MASTDVPSTEPPRDSTVPDSYALNVQEEWIHVWKYRVTPSARDGTWEFVETFDRVDGPYLSLEYATFTVATDGEYWVYSRSYDCKLDCE